MSQLQSTIQLEIPKHGREPIASSMLDTNIGALFLQASNYGLTHLSLQRPTAALPTNEHAAEAQKILQLAEEQLEEYFSGTRKQFSLPLAPRGTEFQHQVWQALQNTHYGNTCSYSDIANTISRPKAVRAVGAANGANPIAIIVPCHRIIGKSGDLTGYAHGLEVKRKLLELEGAQISLL